jgi:hypothetical protein
MNHSGFALHHYLFPLMPSVFPGASIFDKDTKWLINKE